MRDFVLKGTVLYSESPDSIKSVEGGYAVCTDGKCAGVFSKLPERYRNLPIYDHGDRLIIPGMTDLHIHAAQFQYRGLYMDEQLLDWLYAHAFPEEAKFADPAYAEKAYGIFVNALKKSPTTRACVFASAHTEATEILMRLLDASGIGAYVGRVNMDVDAPDNLKEQSAEFSDAETRRFLDDTIGKYEKVFPILTPRFVLSCSRELLLRLCEIEKEYKVPVQSHLSENLSEIAAVRARFPEYETYGEVYDAYQLFGTVGKTLMAHCVYSEEREIELMKKRGVFIAHCPASNTNVITGIAPVRTYLDRGMKMGLASDVAGGHTESMFRAVADTVQMSKQYWRYADGTAKPLTFKEAFYLATKGGGAFFGQVGSLEEGYEFDAVVLDDSVLPCVCALTPAERLERAVYLSLDDRGGIVDKYVSGDRIAL